MRHRWPFGLLGGLMLAGCVAASSSGGPVLVQSPGLPEGYPPQIGVVTAKIDGTDLRWNTYDYSIGAFDASVQVVGEDDTPKLHLTAETGPDTPSNRLVIQGVMRSKLQTGALQDPWIEVIAGEDRTGRRVTSAGGSPVQVVVDAITVDPARNVVGHIKGHFSGSLCFAEGNVVDRSICHTISGSFDSDLQFSQF